MSDLTRHTTWREIHAQPAIWRSWGTTLDVAGLRAWVDGLGVSEVWFCGAGSSAYLGDIIVAGLEGQPGPRLRAVPTTDLVSRPQAYLTGRAPLVVSFGRSGNSAETLGTLAALDALAPDAPRLNITCNADSALAKGPGHKVILPAACHDAGFAMTSSFTTMLLTALAIFDRSLPVAAVSGRFSALSETILPILGLPAPPLPDRAVFLGTGPLAFAAREAALKVLELSAGQIAALWDSTLGFRHGPKSFVRPGTDLWLFPSSDPQAAKYEADLVTELRDQFPNCHVTVLPGHTFPDVWAAALAVVPAQMMAVQWSAALGLSVDDPFAGLGTLSRVVSGVRLHPVVP